MHVKQVCDPWPAIPFILQGRREDMEQLMSILSNGGIKLRQNQTENTDKCTECV